MKLDAPALVTGATGYIGRNLVEKLKASGRSVIAVVRPESNTSWLKDNGIEIVYYTKKSADFFLQIKAARPSTVFHLASHVVVDHKTSDINDLVESNILFGLELAEACNDAGCKSFINTGTYWQNFNSDDYNPVCLYAATKQAYQDILKFYADAKNFRICTLKLYDVYGPNDVRKKILNLIKDAMRNKIPLSMSPGMQRVNFVYIDDVVNAFLIAEQRMINCDHGCFEEFAVRYSEDVSLVELVSLISNLTKYNLPIQFGSRPYRSREVMIPWSGVPLPGWEPKIDLRTGMAEFFAEEIQNNRVKDI